MSSLICYGHEGHLFEIPGFDETIDGVSKCARVKAAESEMARLLATYTEDHFFFAPDDHFFKPMRIPALVLPGDSAKAPDARLHLAEQEADELPLPRSSNRYNEGGGPQSCR
jgi:hypothetical protein